MITYKTISVAHVGIDEFGFCRIKLDSSRHGILGIKEANELCETAYDVCQGRLYKHLIDARDVYGTVEPGAREVIRNHEKLLAVRCAAAIIVNDIANRLIMNFFIRFNKPPYPYRVFSEYEEAVKWLKSVEVPDPIYSE